MVIIYGFGRHANRLLGQYDVPLEEIEVVIDNGDQCNIEGIDTITWKEFVKNRDKYTSKIIVIGSKIYEEEIRKQLIETFPAQSILLIDNWISTYPQLSKAKKRMRTQQLLDDAGTINKNLLRDARLLSHRNDVLKELPKNLIVAEVGVAYGGFSKEILDNMCPSKFYAIDIFDEQVKGFWGSNTFQKSKKTHLEWYKEKFSKEVNQGIVEIRKGKSWECLAQFPDSYFDYVYLDAAHDYYSVQKDVNELKRVVKSGGIIQFNDYIIYDYVIDEFYGVVPVVNRMIAETSSQVLYYCISINGFDDIVIRLNK